MSRIRLLYTNILKGLFVIFDNVVIPAALDRDRNLKGGVRVVESTGICQSKADYYCIFYLCSHHIRSVIFFSCSISFFLFFFNYYRSTM